MNVARRNFAFAVLLFDNNRDKPFTRRRRHNCLFWRHCFIVFVDVFSQNWNDSFFLRRRRRLVERDANLTAVELQLFAKLWSEKSENRRNLQRFQLQRMIGGSLFWFSTLFARIVFLFDDAETFGKKSASHFLVRRFVRRHLVRLRTFRFRTSQPDGMNSSSIESLDLLLHQIAVAGVAVSAAE